MTWADRVQPNIVLMSPDGDEYSAFWTGDPREFEKKLGIFEYPRQTGAVVQDLDPRANRYSFTFYFEGIDHDVTAERFFQSCKQRGEWAVIHPTKGELFLYLIKVQEDIQPVSSANVTKFVTDWIEPESGLFNISIIQQETSAENKVFALQEAAAKQFSDEVVIDEAGPLTQLRSTIESGALTIKRALAPLTQKVAEINTMVESVHRGIVAGVTAAGLNVVSLASQIQTLITLPAKVPESIGVRLDYYQGLLNNIISETFDKPSNRNKNKIVYNELVLTAVLASVSEILIDNTAGTREDAVSFIESVNQMFFDSTTSLDENQTLFSDSIMDQQYFSQSQSFNNAVDLLSDINTLLLRRLFDLAAAKRFTLGKHRTPVEIALTEGVDLDLFIESNQLAGTDILLLEAGREVVVYL